MPIERWSEQVGVLHLADDPQFSEELEALHRLPDAPKSVVLDLGQVTFVNSSNLAHLLRLRKQTVQNEGRLILCGLRTEVWGTFLVTGLDALFEFSDNVATALATVQMGK